MEKLIKLIIAICFLCILFGCATGSVIMTGNVRLAIDPIEVRIYLDPPSQYETIGMVEAFSDVDFSSQVTQYRVMAELKKQSAKIGANGVLLLKTGETTGFYAGKNYSGTTQKKTAQGRAIYVIRE